MGISLRDYTAREALKQIDRFLGGGAMNTVACITAKKLAEAAKPDAVRELVENTDLTICVEADILEAAGIASAGRIREIEERIVLRECLRKVARSGGSVYLLGETEEKALALEKTMSSLSSDLKVAGCAGYDSFEYLPERLMNALNEAAPQIIFSRMTWPKDLELMHQCRKFLNAQLWFALPDQELADTPKYSLFKNIRKILFQKKVNEYNHGKTD